jgi:hypothetical protein
MIGAGNRASIVKSGTARTQFTYHDLAGRPAAQRPADAAVRQELKISPPLPI